MVAGLGTSSFFPESPRNEEARMGACFFLPVCTSLILFEFASPNI